MMSLSRDSPERQGDIRDLELGVVEGRLGEGEPAAGHERRGGGHAHEPRHAADAGTDASLESGVPGVAVPEGCERGREVPPVAVPLPMLDPEPSVVPGVGAS